MTDYAQWLKHGLATTGKSQAALARKMRLAHSAVSRMLTGQRKIKADEIGPIAEFLGIPPPSLAAALSEDRATVRGVRLMGNIGTGVWRTGRAAQPSFTQPVIPAIPDLRFSGMQQYARRMETADAPVGEPGDYVIIVRYDDVRPQPQHGDIVEAHQTRGDLEKWSLRRVRVDKSGHISLDAIDGTGEALPYQPGMITGLVIGSYRSLA